MYAKPIQELIEFFLKFPGVGPRQAARFVFHLLRDEPERVAELSRAIGHLPEAVARCTLCYKIFEAAPGASDRCEMCRDQKRDQNQIMVVEKEVDLEPIERTRKYEGLYHVLGGTIDPLDSSAPARLHVRELFDRVQQLAGAGHAVELILATNPTAEGDATALYLERVFAPLKNQYREFRVSRLGRGLGTGAELEYTDEVTILNALENRK